jgi:hypothetical protein
MIIARQSTARTVIVGPVLDADGVAVTGGLVADFKISKNGAAPAALNGSATLTHRHTGHYSLALTASDLDTVGQAEVVIDDTVNACAPKELTVLEEAVYDVFYPASATGLVIANVTQAAGTAWASGAITAAVFASDAITAAKLHSDVTTELQSGLATASALSTLQTSVNDIPTSSELATALGTADDAVLAAIAALNNLSAAQVATEIADALGTDTYAEPTGVPAATASLAAKLGRLYMALRNGIEVTEDSKTFLDDSGAAEWQKALSDDGTTYTEDEASAP